MTFKNLSDIKAFTFFLNYFAASRKKQQQNKDNDSDNGLTNCKDGSDSNCDSGSSSGELTPSKSSGTGKSIGESNVKL